MQVKFFTGTPPPHLQTRYSYKQKNIFIYYFSLVLDLNYIYSKMGHRQHVTIDQASSVFSMKSLPTPTVESFPFKLVRLSDEDPPANKRPRRDENPHSGGKDPSKENLEN